MRCYLTAGLLMLMLTGCDLFNPEVDKPDEFTDELRVIPSIGVDGVLYGESYPNVVAVLGEPDSSISVNASVVGERTWLFIKYREGVYAGLSIYFIEHLDVPYSGIVHPVDWFSMDTLYTGKAYDGIGIGSTLEEIVSAYGTAVRIDTLNQSGSTLDCYFCYGDKQLQLTTVDSVVTNMIVGYLKLVTTNPCN